MKRNTRLNTLPARDDMLVEAIAIKSTASRRDAMLVRSMIDVDLPTFRPYGTRCFSWT
ncbi:MAG: hypothetical protein LBT09_11820 [Planctomycetaceae bacterium]|nr:hypothetical protein [Planctomycetaceae bacterium]